MNWREAHAYLDSLDFRGLKLGLENTQNLLARLGDPHKEFQTVHVAGTNGKGSTCALISSVLTQAGIPNGLYVSPHLETPRERIQVNGEMITARQTAKLINEVKQAADCVLPLKPTYFEFLTVMALLHFARTGVEVAVVEVGLGGRLDSTNVVAPAMTVITSIAMDHMTALGNDVRQIALEKCGVIKPSIPVVCSARDPLALETITNSAQNAPAPLLALGVDFHATRARMTPTGERFGFTCADKRFDELEVALAGKQQVDNAAAAVMALLTLEKTGVAQTRGAIEKGLEKVRCPGRFEQVSSSPTIIMDGAHNPQAALALRDTLLERFGPCRVDIIFGAMRDKDYQAMLESLQPVAKSFTLYAPDVPRAEHARAMALAQSDKTIPTRIAEDFEGLRRMLETAAQSAVICVTGSFYTVGELRGKFRETGLMER